MRARFTLRLAGGLAALALPACGGGDLLLPSSGVPAELRLVSGDLQQAEAGSPLPDPLVVAAVDGNGRPVQGSSILFRFELSSDGGQVNPDTVLTNEEGRATAQVRLGSEVGAHPVEAVVVDGPTGLRVRFLLTALQPDRGPTGGGGDGGGGGGGDDGGNGGGNDDGGGTFDGGGGGGGTGGVDGGGGGGNDDGSGKEKGHKGKGGKDGKGKG
jgi:hypothetical protein